VKRKGDSRQQQRTNYSWLVIPVAVLVTYLPALHGGPLWDDFGHITVPELRSLTGLWRIWSELGATQQYYPVLHVAFWLEHRLWGDAFVGYHLANVALHSASAVLLVLILRRLGVPGGLLAGLIFALHPVTVESVAWMAEQKNTLSAMFYLASALVYLRFAEAGLKPCATEAKVRLKADTTGARSKADTTGARSKADTTEARSKADTAGARSKADTAGARSSTTVVSGFSRTVSVAQPFRTADYWLAFALFICALLTKTVTATLPAALLLVFWWQRGRIDWRRDVQPLLPWFIVAVIAAAFTAWFEREVIGAKGDDFALTLVERCLVAGRVVWFYLGKLIWPRSLIFIYPRWDIDASVWWQYLFPAAAIAMAIGLALLRRRGPLAGYLYFCGTLVPVLGFFDVYPFLFSYVADHFQYLASLGVIVPVASALAIAAERLGQPKRRIAAVAGTALVAALAVMTWNRSGVYRDAETLYRDTIARNPAAWMAYQNLGTELAAQNRLDEAIIAYEGALRARPGYAAAKSNLVLAHIKRADAAGESPDGVAGAIAHYEAVLRLEPDHFRAHYNAGTLLMDIPARQPEALRHLESAVRIQPDSVEARVNLGVLLADVPSRSREAIEHLEFAVAKRPDLARLRELIDDVKSRK
jgi:tetratricopeptide (TPR) repeat protein